MGVRGGGGGGESQCANYRINAELPSSNVRSLKYFCGEKFILFIMFFNKITYHKKCNNPPMGWKALYLIGFHYHYDDSGLNLHKVSL